MSEDEFLKQQRTRHPRPWTDEYGVLNSGSSQIELTHFDLHYFFDALFDSVRPSPIDGFPVPSDRISVSLEALKEYLQGIYENTQNGSDFKPRNYLHDAVLRSNLLAAVALLTNHKRPKDRESHDSFVWKVETLGHDFLMALDGDGLIYSVVPIGFVEYLNRTDEQSVQLDFISAGHIAQEHLELPPPTRDFVVLLYLRDVVAPICDELISKKLISGLPPETIELFLLDFVRTIDDRIDEIAAENAFEFAEGIEIDLEVTDEPEIAERSSNIPMGSRSHPALGNATSDPSEIDTPKIKELYRFLEEDFPIDNYLLNSRQ